MLYKEDPLGWPLPAKDMLWRPLRPRDWDKSVMKAPANRPRFEGVNSLMVHFSSPKAEVGRFGAIVLQLCKLSTANEFHQIVLVTIQVKCAKLRSARHSCNGQQSLRDCKESALMIAEVTCHIYGELQSCRHIISHLCHITSVSVCTPTGDVPVHKKQIGFWLCYSACTIVR